MREFKPANERFREAAARAGLEADICVFEKSSRTAEEAAEACGCDAGQIVKSLIFRGARSGRAVVLLVSGSNRVDLAIAEAEVGEGLQRADADFARTATGYAIGGIPPLGHAETLATFMDRDLLAHAEVWAAAGTPNSVFPVAPDMLRKASGARIITVA